MAGSSHKQVSELSDVLHPGPLHGASPVSYIHHPVLVALLQARQPNTFPFLRLRLSKCQSIQQTNKMYPGQQQVLAFLSFKIDVSCLSGIEESLLLRKLLLILTSCFVCDPNLIGSVCTELQIIMQNSYLRILPPQIRITYMRQLHKDFSLMYS